MKPRFPQFTVVAMLLLILPTPPARGVEAAKAPQLRPFAATNRAEAVAWQQQQLPALVEGLGLTEVLARRKAPGPKGDYGVPLNPKILKQEDKGSYTQYELSLDNTADWTSTRILTVPRGAGKFPAVVLIEGGLDRVYGDTNSCGVVLARAGYITLYVDLAGGAANLKAKGLSIAAQRTLAGIRAVDYLCTRPDVDPARMGCAGLCKFGMIATWVTVVDSRIQALVSSATLIKDQGGRYYDFNGQKFDLRDWYAMIAPRALLCQFGRQDGLGTMFPSGQDLADVGRYYGVFGAPERLQVFWHPGGHMIEGSSLPEFFGKALAVKADVLKTDPK